MLWLLCLTSGLARPKIFLFKSKTFTRGSLKIGKTWSSKSSHAGATSTTFGSRRRERKISPCISSALRISLATQKIYLWTSLPSLSTNRASKALSLRARLIFWWERKLMALPTRNYINQEMPQLITRICIVSLRSNSLGLRQSWDNFLTSSSTTWTTRLSSLP